MKDLIERQAALDAIRSIKANYCETADDQILLIDKAMAMTELMMLPSAQPAIIHCRDCKYYYFADNSIPQEQRYTCDLDGDRWPADSFCSFAERRKDED